MNVYMPILILGLLAFGFALFYLRGVAPKEVTTGHIYRGIIPFVVIQVGALGLLWLFPGIVTIVPDLMPN